MGTFKDFEEIEAWIVSRRLAHSIREICRKEVVRRDYAFIDQITRAARSVSANIAEGNDSMTIAEFINLLGYSKRSAAEVRSHLYDALDEKYITQTEFDQLADQTKKICSMIAKLIHYLRSLNQTVKRTFEKNVSSKNE